MQCIGWLSINLECCCRFQWDKESDKCFRLDSSSPRDIKSRQSSKNLDNRDQLGMQDKQIVELPSCKFRVRRE